ncbi:hypothetical protein BJP07_02345 [Corynebacterium sp. NML130628]|nr:hypothetical protein BJP07_02345 [Corynebacterium sp. NML130628]
MLGGTTPASAHVDVKSDGSECRALKSQFQRGQKLDITRFTFPGDHNTGIRNNTLYLYDTTGHHADIEYAANLWVDAVRARGGYLDIKFIDNKTPEAVSVIVDPNLPVLGRVTGGGPTLTVRISPRMFGRYVEPKSRIMTIAHEMGHAMALAHSCDNLLMVSGYSSKPGVVPQPLDAEILILRNNLRQKPTPTPSPEPSPEPSPLPPVVTTTISERPKPTPTTSSSSSTSTTPTTSAPSQPSLPDLPPLPMPTIPSAQPLPTTTVTSTAPTISSSSALSSSSSSSTLTQPSSPKPSPTGETHRIVLPEYVAPPKPSTEAEGKRIVDETVREFVAAQDALNQAENFADRIISQERVKNARRAFQEAQDNLEVLRQQLASETSTPPTSAPRTTTTTPTSTTTSATASAQPSVSAPRTTTSKPTTSNPLTTVAPTTSTTSAQRTTPTVGPSTSVETSTSTTGCCPNCGATTPQFEAPTYVPAVKPRTVEEARAVLAAATAEHEKAEDRMTLARRTKYAPIINEAQADLDRTFFRVKEAQKNLDELLAKEPTPTTTDVTSSAAPSSVTTSVAPSLTTSEVSTPTSATTSAEAPKASVPRTAETTSATLSTTSVEPSAEPSTSEAPKASAPRATETTSAAPSSESIEPSTSEAPKVSAPRTTTPTTTLVEPAPESPTTLTTTASSSKTESATTSESAARTTEETSEPEVGTSTSEPTPEPSVPAPATCAKDGSSSGSSENCEGSSKGGIIAAILVPLLALLGAAAFWAKDHLKF